MKPLIRILHLEDDRNDVELVNSRIEEAGLACWITPVQTRDEFEGALRQDEYDIILSDFRLPMYDGMSALRLTRQLRPDVPFVFVSGTMGEEAAIEALKQGATDYVLKQKMLRLASAVERALREAENRRERERIDNIMQARLRLLEFANTHSMDELLIATLDEMEALTGSSIGFYHLLEEDQKMLSLQSWSTNTLKNMCTAEGKGTHYDIAQAGVWVDCVHERRPVIHNDYASLAHRKGMPEGHAPVIRELVVPILRGNLIKAIVGVGNKPADYDESDIEIVSHLADLSWDIVERKRTEESLNLFRALIERSNDAIEVFDPKTGHFLDVNEKCCADLGYNRKEFLSLRVSDIDPNIDLSSLSEIMKEVRKKTTLSEERLHRRKDGTIFPVEINLSYVHLDRDYIVSVARDITDRKRAEEAIRESEKKYRTILESIEEGYYECDLRGNIIFFNDSMCKISGYSSDELMGMNSRNYLPPKTAMKVYEIFNKIYQTGKSVSRVCHELIKKDGSKITVEASASLIRDSEDEPVGFRGIMRDVTEEKKIEMELIQTKDFLQNIFNSSAEGIITTDLHGKIIYMSPRVKDILGYNQEELIGKKVYSFYRNGKEDAKAIMKALTEKGELRKHEIKFMIRDGRLVDINLSASLLKDETGETIGTLGILSDITEEKKLEAQLQQAQKMEAIGTLASGVAHDFNNILTTIIGNAELMLTTTSEDHSLREEIEEIKSAGERAAALTRQLLAFSRKQIIRPEILDLNALLAGIEKMLVRLIGENIEFLIIPESALWFVEIDPGQMEQAIMNVVINAKDAMPNGGKLTIQTANTDLSKSYFAEHGIVENQPGPYVMVAIIDTGSGMDKETQEHIFEPFYSTKEKYKGTGLGLSMVYGIVKQNSGFIWVYSEPGQGSIFKIFLPRAKKGIKTEEEEQTPVENFGGSETILIVEDDALLLSFAQKALQQYGYRVLTARNGEDALRIGREYEGPIDLMVTDVVMTTMSGKETAERLQLLYSQMKVIYMSGYTNNVIVHFGVLEPGLNFLEKPFSTKGLARKVREVLDK